MDDFPRLSAETEEAIGKHNIKLSTEMRTKLQKVSDPTKQAQCAVNPGFQVMLDYALNFDHMMQMIAYETRQYRTTPDVAIEKPDKGIVKTSVDESSTEVLTIPLSQDMVNFLSAQLDCILYNEMRQRFPMPKYGTELIAPKCVTNKPVPFESFKAKLYIA